MPLGLGGNPYASLPTAPMNTGGAVGNSNFYYTPQPYAQNGGNTQLGQIMLEQNPATAYYRYGQQIGVGDDQTGFNRWFRQQFPSFSLGYNAYTIDHPFDADIQGYANSLGGYDSWMKQYMRLAPQLRGEDPSSRGSGPSRWIAR